MEKDELKTEAIIVNQAKFEEASKVVDSEKKITAMQEDLPRFEFFNDGLRVTAPVLGGLPKDDERQSIFTLYTPNGLLIDRVVKDGSVWAQHIEHNGKLVGPTKPRLRSTGGHVTGRAAIELVRRNSARGGTLTFPLYHTGIHVTMEPAVEHEFINLEFTLQHAATQVGLSTTGLLLNARSGVFSESLARFALEHIVSTNYPCGADEIVETLLDVVSPLDYATLVWGVLATKFANGHPWDFKCSSKECNHSETATIFFSRMLWGDKSALTEKQLNILAGNKESITEDLLKQYREEFKHQESFKITLEDGLIIELGATSLRDYFTSAKRWVEDIEQTYTKGMTNYASPERRNAFLDGQIQARRTLKYEHLIRTIKIPGDIEGDYVIVDDRETIRDILIEYATLDVAFAAIENGCENFLEDSTLAIVGYPARKCVKCGTDASTEEGRFRSIIPIAVDRILFMLARQRNMVMSAMASV